jgi:hypothetical protein
MNDPWVYNGKDKPDSCIRCRAVGSAEGYYTKTSIFGPPKIRVGICRKHKAYGGGRINWYEKGKR